jgi:lipooligosaccharide transport system permease protein
MTIPTEGASRARSSAAPLAAPRTATLSAASERALAAAARSRRYGSWYVAEHRLRGMRSYAQTIIATSIGNPLVYLFALGVGLASLVNKNMGDVAGPGVGYLAFVAPALLATAAVTVAVEETTYPVLMGFKWNPIFFAMNAAPISGNQIVNGIVIAVAARIVPTVGIYFVFMVLFGAVPSGWGVLGILVATLTGLSIGMLIMAYTATVTEDTGQMAIIMRFIITPMFLFSGTFFPLSQLPIYLQWIGWISPLWHGTQLGRVLSYGMSEPVWLSVIHVLYPLLLAVGGWKSAQNIVTRRLNR